MNMKRIHLIRHAKSSWSDPSREDEERPLNQRGLASCALMAQHIADAGCDFSYVYSSKAVRAQQTIVKLEKALPRGRIDWNIDDRLYTFDHQDLYPWFRALSHTVDDVTVIGHNPALTDFTNTVSDQPINNLPTCGYIQLRLDVEHWHSLAANTCMLLYFLTPKRCRLMY